MPLASRRFESSFSVSASPTPPSVAVAVALVLVATSSCQKGTEDRPEQRPAPAVVSAAPEVTPTAASELRHELREDAVRNLIGTWLGAQNTVDFVSYARCYADRFTGIKRVGQRTRRFDREAWLLDRESMFKPGMRVAIEAVQLEVAATSARVRFTQTFATDAFQDAGEKELLVVATRDGPRIAREEMLTSEVSRSESSYAPIWAVSDGVVHLGEAFSAEVAQGPIERGKGEGGAWVAQRRLDQTRLESETRAWVGKPLLAMDAGGRPCETKVAELLGRVDLIPHFGTVQHWQGQTFGVESASPPPSAAEIDEELWNLGTFSGAKLAGGLSNRCPEAIWATEVPPRGKVLAPTPPSSELQSLLRRSLAEHPAARDVQKVFSESSPERSGKAWLDEARLAFFTFDPVDSLQLAVASASVGEGCSDILEGVTVAFELDVRGDAPRVLRALTLEGVSELLRVVSAVDFDGDGRFELFTSDEGLTLAMSYFRPGGRGYTRQLLRSSNYLDCPC